MAFRLKHWLGIVALSFVAVSAWRLPLDHAPPRELDPRSPEELRYRALSRELRETRAVLAQLRRGSSLPDRLLERATDGVGVMIPPHPREDPAEVAALSSRVRDVVQGLTVRDPRMVVGYAYVLAGEESADLPVGRVDRYETYAGRRNGTPYCLQVRVTRSSLVPDLLHRDVELRQPGSLLGPCVQYAEHGLPGPEVRRWLEAGGAHFAMGERTGPRPDFRRFLTQVYRPTVATPLIAADGSVYLAAGEAMQPERCLAGDADVCAALFLEPDAVDPTGASERAVARRSPALWAGRLRTRSFPADNEYLVADLEARFGPEAFHRFWTSDDDVRTAFESSFGVDLGEWLVEWLDAGPGIEPATPAPTLTATFESLLLVGLMTGLATFWQKRRRVA